MKPLTSALLTATACFLADGKPLRARGNGMIYDFSELTPSADLVWTPCYDNFTCALLEVPLDYTDPTIGTTNIAFLRKLSDDPNAEDVLVNSGGPGGSGVDMVLSGHELITEKVGLQFNLIGFDPRGVSNSGPDIKCFPDVPGYPGVTYVKNAFYADVFDVVDVDSENRLAESFARHGAYGDWCTGVYSRNGTAKYASTVAVANDMRHYIELAAKCKGRPAEEAKLYYYGISYGTVLGATYAALFPDRIARMIVDGVVDLEDYYGGSWRTATQDADKTARAFFSGCFEAGPENCAFHKNASSADEIEQRYIAILDSLSKTPIAVADPLNPLLAGLNPNIIRWQDLAWKFFVDSYWPVTAWSTLAEILALLEIGDATGLASQTTQGTLVIPLPFDMREPRTLISCLDANGRFNTSTIEEYAAHFEYVGNQSAYAGVALASIAGPICRSLKVSPPESQAFSGTPSVNKTSAPIFWIGNTADPVTPLSSAHKMAKFFPESSVLTVDMPGHTTFRTKSQCLHNYTQAYMIDASLPPSGTVCESDIKPFAGV